MRCGDWIQTYTGRKFWPVDPRPEEVCLEDIAHALSLQCRFAGHALRFYSVAQHSVLVSRACEPADALWGLLHDASEAYLVDVARPLKKLPEFAAYRSAEEAIMGVVCARFGLPARQPSSVTRADTALLATEARDLMAPPPERWTDPALELADRVVAAAPQEAEAQFLARFAELGGRA